MDSSLSLRDRTASVLCRNPFLAVVACVVIGIVLDQFFKATIHWWMMGSWVSLVAVWILLCRTSYRCLVFWLLSITTIFLYASLHHLHWRLFETSDVSRVLAPNSMQRVPVRIEVMAAESTLIRDGRVDPLATLPGGDRTALRVQVKQIYAQNQWKRASGVLDMFVDGHVPNIKAGMRIRVLGTLSRIPRPLNEGERDRRFHKRADRILCQLHVGNPDSVTVVETNRSWKHPIEASRAYCHDAINRRLARDNVELGKALMLGARDGVSRETIDAFFLTGTMHLLAISGLHVGILAFAFLSLARRGILPQRLALLFVMIFIGLYAILTGARPPVIRATILIQIVCMSWVVRRQPNAINSLAVAALVILTMNTAELFRVGAQLSFIAVASLTSCASRLTRRQPEDPLDRLIWRTRTWSRRFSDWTRFKLWQMFAASIIVWLISLPLVSNEFHVVSPFAVLLNVIMAIPVAGTLFCGVITLVSDWLCPPIATFSAAICDHCLAMMHRTVDVFQPIPGSHFWTSGYGTPWTLLFYVLAIASGLHVLKLNMRWAMFGFLAWLTLPIIVANIRGKLCSQPLVATFIAVGHGSSVLLEFPNGRNLLYDCGHMGRPDSCVDSVSSVLWSRGVNRLDSVIISHADADHYNALPGLLDRFSVGGVIVSPQMLSDESDSVRFLHQSIRNRNIPIQTVDHRHCLNVAEDIPIRILHPPLGIRFESDNASSIALAIFHPDATILLPGDIEDDGLKRLMLQQSIDCDLVMAPHHGSPRSRPEEFSAWSEPDTTVISQGHNSNKQSVDATFARYGTVFRTNRDGAITATIGDHGISLRSFVE